MNATLRDLDLGCAYCQRVHRELIADGDDLVCAPGHGCASAARARKPAVARTRTPGPKTVRVVERDPDVCACGGASTHLELRAGHLVGCCAECSEIRG